MLEPAIDLEGGFSIRCIEIETDYDLSPPFADNDRVLSIEGRLLLTSEVRISPRELQETKVGRLNRVGTEQPQRVDLLLRNVAFTRMLPRQRYPDLSGPGRILEHTFRSASVPLAGGEVPLRLG